MTRDKCDYCKNWSWFSKKLENDIYFCLDCIEADEKNHNCLGGGCYQYGCNIDFIKKIKRVPKG